MAKSRPKINKSKTEVFLDHLYSYHYRERPVNISTFVRDKEYLGNAFGEGETLHDVWLQALNQIFQDDSKVLVVFTGSIGCGKTTAALVAMAYTVYKLLCLKNPWEFFGKGVLVGKMAISFFNLTKSLGESKGAMKFHAFLASSPWFRRQALNGARVEKGLATELDFPLLDFILSSPYSKGFGNIGQDVIVGIMDELDSPTESRKQKEKVLSAYASTYRRFESRFLVDGHSLGRLFLVCSKQDDLSFVETFITKMKDSGRLLVFDVPIWETKPKREFSGVKFNIVYGDAFHQPKILEPEDDVTAYLKNGYKAMQVPIEYLTSFKTDMVGSLRDIAGVSIAGSRRWKFFPSEVFVQECFDGTKQDPVNLPTIYVGLKDEVRFIWYLTLEKIRMPKNVQRYIHCDISFSGNGDAMGISMCGIKEWKNLSIQNIDGSFSNQRVPIIETDFVMRIKGKEGDRIPLTEVPRLVLDLKAAGYPVKFSADLKVASETIDQILKKAGIETKYVSVDKTDKPYVTWRNLVYDKRWVLHQSQMVLFEAKNLEYMDGKVDHPNEVKEVEILGTGDYKETVMMGSKDMVDSIVGAVSYCLEDAGSIMDTQAMASALQRISGGANNAVTSPLQMVDASGNQIVGIKTGSSMTRMADILKKSQQR